jgi:hypothetical protein
MINAWSTTALRRTTAFVIGTAYCRSMRGGGFRLRPAATRPEGFRRGDLFPMRTTAV